MKINAAMRGLNHDQLKYIAAAAMLADHIGAFLLPPAGAAYVLCRLIGRLTAPVMSYLLAEGFRYTASRPKYALRLAAFALLSQVPYAFVNGGLFKTNLNVLFTLLIAFCMLAAYEAELRPPVKWGLIAALFLGSAFGDWGLTAPLWVMLFYRFRGNIPRQMAAFACVAGAEALRTVIAGGFPGALWQFGMFLAIPLLLLYNGQQGRGGAFNKWFFYAFYPLHLLAIGLIAQWIR